MKEIVLALIMALGANSAYAEPPKPLMWKVSDADNSLYLLGSFHMLKEEDHPLADSVNAAFDDAEQLYFEISPAEMNDTNGVAKKMFSLGSYTNGKTLQQNISAETWSKLEAYASAKKFPVANLQALEPWLVGLLLSSLEAVNAGMKPELGLDKHFIALAEKTKKSAFGLETVDEELAAFDTMDPKVQEQVLMQTFDGGDMAAVLDKLHKIWRNGDEKALTKEMINDMRDKYPEYYQSLLVVRNKAWIPKLDAFLKDNDKDDALVVVGAGHLVGDDSVVQLLKAKGYKVERLK
jgi:uncharacterized protein